MIIDDAVPSVMLPPLAPNSPHSEACGSEEDENFARALHDHPMFREDSTKVCYYLEESVRSAQHAASIKP